MERLLGPPVAHTLAVGPPPPPPADPPEVRLDTDGADWGAFEDPCLAFFLVDGDTPPQRLRALLAASWHRDPHTTLKLICNHRGVRGSGKGDREVFYNAALWMKKGHPFTLAGNLAAFAEFGYIKDFPEILYRLVKGADVRKVEKEKAKAWATVKASDEEETGLQAGRKRARGHPAADPERARRRIKAMGAGPEEEQTAGHKSQPAPGAYANKVAWLAARALQMYNGDRNYRVLFDGVSEFFAERLRSDIDKVAAGKGGEVGLAAKWCPSLDSSFNQATLLCEAIARRMFPNPNLLNDAAAADPQEQSKYVYGAIKRLRREVLVPLRKVLQLPEIYMSAGKWSELPYDRVASKAMERYTGLFMRHDEDRFTRFIAHRDARKAPAGAAVATMDAGLLPHHVVSMTKVGQRGGHKWRIAVCWRKIVAAHRDGGVLCNCVPVLDLSDSLRGVRRDVCLALGLLVSELGQQPWENFVYPFGSGAGPCVISQPHDIWSRLDAVQQIHCSDKKIDLRAVLDYILTMALWLEVRPDNMIRTIFVLTDQPFEQALARPQSWAREYKVMCEKFTDNGFGDVVPQIVYWNLVGRRSAALTSAADGVLRLSGFSDSFFELFLKRGGIVGPNVEMQASIEGPNYDKLRVLD
jgi:hypothetical protein